MGDNGRMERRRYKIRSPEVWNRVRDDYLSGMPAADVALKHDVTEASLRARACKQGWSRYLHPEASTAAPPPAMALFEPLEGQGEASDPATLARQATLASGRAMSARMWSEAKALAALAETFQKLADREGGGRGELTVETAPLQLVFDILMMEHAQITKRFGVDPDDHDACPLKTAFWKKRGAEIALNGDFLESLSRQRFAIEDRVEALEAQVIAAGMTPVEENERRRLLRTGREMTIRRNGTVVQVPVKEWREVFGCE